MYVYTIIYVYYIYQQTNSIYCLVVYIIYHKNYTKFTKVYLRPLWFSIRSMLLCTYVYIYVYLARSKLQLIVCFCSPNNFYFIYSYYIYRTLLITAYLLVYYFYLIKFAKNVRAFILYDRPSGASASQRWWPMAVRFSAIARLHNSCAGRCISNVQQSRLWDSSSRIPIS